MVLLMSIRPTSRVHKASPIGVHHPMGLLRCFYPYLSTPTLGLFGWMLPFFWLVMMRLPIVLTGPTRTILLEQQGDGGEQRKQRDKAGFGSNPVVVISIEPHGWVEDKKKKAAWPDLGDEMKTSGQSTALILLQVPCLDGGTVTREQSFAIPRVPMWVGPISNFRLSTYVGPHVRMKIRKTSSQQKVAAKTDFQVNEVSTP